MVPKGSLWASEEVNCMFKLRAGQLNSTHKNAEIYAMIWEYLGMRGHSITAEQRWDNVKKLWMHCSEQMSPNS